MGPRRPRRLPRRRNLPKPVGTAAFLSSACPRRPKHLGFLGFSFLFSSRPARGAGSKTASRHAFATAPRWLQDGRARFVLDLHLRCPRPPRCVVGDHEITRTTARTRRTRRATTTRTATTTTLRRTISRGAAKGTAGAGARQIQTCTWRCAYISKAFFLPCKDAAVEDLCTQSCGRRVQVYTWPAAEDGEMSSYMRLAEMRMKMSMVCVPWQAAGSLVIGSAEICVCHESLYGHVFARASI